MFDLYPDNRELITRLEREPAALFIDAPTKVELVRAIIEGQRALYAGEVEFVFIKRDLPDDLNMADLLLAEYATNDKPFTLEALAEHPTLMPKFKREIDFICDDQELITAASRGFSEEFVICNLLPDPDFHIDNRKDFLPPKERDSLRGVAVQSTYYNTGVEITPLSNIADTQVLDNENYLNDPSKVEWCDDISKGLRKKPGNMSVTKFTLKDPENTFTLPEGWVAMWHTSIAPHKSSGSENRLNVVQKRIHVAS